MMKTSIAAFCFMFALSPLVMAQGKADEKKAAPPAAAKADEKKAAPAATAPAPAAAPAAAPAKGEGKKPAAGGKSGDKKAERKGKGEPTEAQKAQRAKMKSCAADASTKNLKGDERKKFMSSCLKG